MINIDLLNYKNMMHFNFLAIIVAALVSIPVSFIWYNPKVFGNVWMKEIGVTDPEKMKEGVNMVKIFCITFIFSFLLAIGMMFISVHQTGLNSLLEGQPVTKTSNVQLLLDGKPIDWLNSFRTFKHGALHGFMGSIFYVLPLIGTQAVYERRSFKYIFIHVGYWAITMMLMGGILSVWL